MSKVKLCKTCRNKSIDGDLLDLGYFPFETDIKECPFCHTEWEDSILEIEELDILLEISRSASFFDAIIDLKEKDIIEYNLKMSQFKTQLSQTKQVEEESKPHCPHCKSTNIKSISGMERGASIAMWGIFSKKINKSFKCNNCGYTW